MFIKPLSYYIHNVRSRTVGKSTKDCKSGREKEGIGRYRRSRIQRVSIKSKFTRRNEKDSGEFCVQDKQYQFYSSTPRKGQAWAKAKSVVLSIPFFFIYNPQILFTLIYIDSMFIDEMISINIIQLQSMFHNIHNLNNGV